MLKIAIVDDEPSYVNKLLDYVEEYKKNEKVSVSVDIYNNGADFLTDYKPDYTIVFIDIEMPIMDGIETAKKLRKIDERVPLVFVTNMAQFAIKGYQVNALDFIVKPISYFNFASKIKKADEIVKKYLDDKVVVNSGTAYMSLSVRDIFYLEVFKHDLIYHTCKGNIKVKGVMKERASYFESKNFVRIHNCFLVNLEKVVEFKGMTLRLSNDEELPVSQSKRQAVKNAILGYFLSWGGGDLINEYISSPDFPISRSAVLIRRNFFSRFEAKESLLA